MFSVPALGFARADRRRARSTGDQMNAPAIAMHDVWDKRYLAEFVGTLALVLIGCGAITVGGWSRARSSTLDASVEAATRALS